MPDFATTYDRVVLDRHLDLLVRAYLRAQGELEEEDGQWISVDRALQAKSRYDDQRARELREQFDRPAIRSRHQTLIGECIEPVARHWLGHHLFGARELAALVHLLGGEDLRFDGPVSDVLRSHASYAIRYAFRELSGLLGKFPAMQACASDDQQEDAWLPLFRHLIREAIVRAYHEQCRKGGLPTPDWHAVLETLVGRLENDLRSASEAESGFIEYFGLPDDDDDDDPAWTPEQAPADTETWLIPAQSVASNYDRNDAEHIRRLIEHVADGVATAGARPAECRSRSEFACQLRLRFACTAYTHIVRGVATRIVEQERLPDASEFLQQALKACDQARDVEPEVLREINQWIDGAIAACAMPFAPLAMRKLDVARTKLKKALKSAAPGSTRRAELDDIVRHLERARMAWDIGPGEIQAHVLQMLAGCGITEKDDDCGDALSWLRTIGDSAPFGKTFDERLTRARKAVAGQIAEAWDGAIAERLDEFLALKEACGESAVGLSVAGFLEASSIWALPPAKWADALATQAFADDLSRILSADQEVILADINVNLAAKRIDYAALRKELAVTPKFLQAWNLIRDVREAYGLLFVLVRMRRNAPIRVFKYFTAICRLAENKGKDAETTMDLEQWMATTERLFSALEEDYFGEAFSNGGRFVGFGDWIDGRRGSPASSSAQALLPYYSLWGRLLEGARPTSRAVPYLNSVRPALRPWFDVQATASA